MGHNPPRPKSLDARSVSRIAREVASSQQRQWHDLGELADLLGDTASRQKTVTITAGTAAFIASHLRTAHAKPTRNEVAKLLCKHDCTTPCYECTGRANIIVSAYGASLD